MGLETIAMVSSIAGTAMSAMGAIQQGNAASSAAGYNAQVAANNAKIATQNAAFAGEQGEQNVAASMAKTRALIGATLANQGASGVDVNSGSFSDVRESEAKLGMTDALNIRADAARKAYGYQTDSASFTGQSQLAKSEQKSAKIGGYLNAGATVLGGVGKSYDVYGDFLSKSDPTAGLTAGDEQFMSHF